MRSPEVSVVMSIYNEPEEWLREAIESILTQSFTRFEFIIINDYPIRKINNLILKEYAGKDSRIIQIINEKNIGLTKSLNKGFKVAKGKYIARMDGDDISVKTRFEKQYKFMEDNPAIIVCGTNIEYFGEVEKKNIGWIKEKDEDLKNHLFIGNCFAHPTIFIRKKCLDKKGLLYNENFKNAQDYKLWSELRDSGDFYNISEILLKYRISANQIRIVNKKDQTDYSYEIRKSIIESFLNKYSDKQYIYPKEITVQDFRQVFLVEKKVKERKRTTAIFNSNIVHCHRASVNIFVFLISRLILFRADLNKYEVLRLIKRTLF